MTGALEPAERAVRILQASLRDDHPVLGSALLTLGQVLALNGRQDEAVDRGRQSLGILEKRFPPDHPTVIGTHRLLKELTGNSAVD